MITFIIIALAIVLVAIVSVLIFRYKTGFIVPYYQTIDDLWDDPHSDDDVVMVLSLTILAMICFAAFTYLIVTTYCCEAKEHRPQNSTVLQAESTIEARE